MTLDNWQKIRKCRAPADIKPSATLRHERCCWVSTAAQQMNAETSLHRLQIDAKSCVPSWNRAETGRVSRLAGGQSRDEDGYDAFSDPAESIFSASQQGPLNVRRLNQPSASDMFIIIMTLILRKIEIMWWIPKRKRNEDAFVSQVVLARLL